MDMDAGPWRILEAIERAAVCADLGDWTPRRIAQALDLFVRELSLLPVCRLAKAAWTHSGVPLFC